MRGARPGRSLFFGSEKCGEIAAHLSHVVAYRVPYDFEIDLAVVVNHPVAQSRHLAEGKSFEAGDCFRIEAGRGFADHQQPAEYCILGLRVPQKVLAAITLYVALDGLGGMKDIQQVRCLPNLHTLRGQTLKSTAAVLDCRPVRQTGGSEDPRGNREFAPVRPAWRRNQALVRRPGGT